MVFGSRSKIEESEEELEFCESVRERREKKREVSEDRIDRKIVFNIIFFYILI